MLAGNLHRQLTWLGRAQWGLAAVMATASAGVWLLAVRPASDGLAAADARLDRDLRTLQESNSRVRQLPYIDAEIRRLRDRVARFDKTIPTRQDLSAFIGDVTRISKDASLQKWTCKPDATPIRTGEVARLPIHFGFEGDFVDGLVPFLRQTEDLRRLTRVRKLELKSPDGSGTVKVDLTMDLFFTDD